MAPLTSRIGAMREVLAFQSTTLTTSTGTGFSTAVPTTFATVMGEYLQPGSGRESWQQAAVVAEMAPAFRIRYRTDIEPKQQVLWRGQTLQIHAVIPVMAVGNRFLIVQTGLTQ